MKWKWKFFERMWGESLFWTKKNLKKFWLFFATMLCSQWVSFFKNKIVFFFSATKQLFEMLLHSIDRKQTNKYQYRMRTFHSREIKKMWNNVFQINHEFVWFLIVWSCVWFVLFKDFVPFYVCSIMLFKCTMKSEQ